MSLKDIRALTFDTGGTILDWHTGFSNAFAGAGAKHGIEHDWAELTNELRRRSLKAMLNLGEHEPPAYTFDGAHRFTVEALVKENGFDAFTEEDIHAISYEAPHNFKCWPDFPAVQPRLREKYHVASFTILSYRLIMGFSQGQRALLGRSVLLRRHRQVQTPALLLSDRGEVSAARCGTMLHGGVSQLRP